MAMPNQALQAPRNDLMFAATITKPGFQKLINNALGDPSRAKRFTASIVSAVNTNAALQDCRAETMVPGMSACHAAI